MEPSAGTGLTHLLNATRWSLAGLREAWREAAFRQEVVLLAILLPAALLLGKTAPERALLAGSLFLVLIVELLNTAIEAAIDRIGPERHPLAARAKDVGSAAVMVTLLATGTVWGLVLWG